MLFCLFPLGYLLSCIDEQFISSVNAEYALVWTKFSGLLYTLMEMEVCICISSAEAAEIYANRRIKFQAENETEMTICYYNMLSICSLCDCRLR